MKIFYNVKKSFMKSTFSVIVFFILSLICTGSFAQKGKAFMGTITYEVIYDGNLEPAVKAQLPSDAVFYIKGNKVLQESKSSMGTQSVVIDGDSKTNLILIDMMGQQLAIKVPKEDVEKQLKEVPVAKVEFFEETKKIAGYNCKKVEITEGDNTTTAYYSTDFNCPEINWATPYKDIKGVLLEYSTSQQGITAKYTAKEVKETKVKDNKFTVPVGFKELTPDEAKKMFGGGE